MLILLLAIIIIILVFGVDEFLGGLVELVELLKTVVLWITNLALVAGLLYASYSLYLEVMSNLS